MTATTEPPNEKTLLGLPPELRNRIYRYALVTSHRVNISASQPNKPGLLSCCKQIPVEATGIFTRENIFSTTITDLRPSIPHSHWLRRDVRGRSCGLHLAGSPNWQNFEVWLKQIHAREIPAFSIHYGAVNWHRAAVRAVKIVVQMRRVEWAVVESVLQEYKEALDSKGRTDWKWA